MAPGPTIPSGYRLIGTGDFDRDGKPDYLLFKPSTSGTVIWYLNNNTLVSGKFGPVSPGGVCASRHSGLQCRWKHGHPVF